MRNENTIKSDFALGLEKLIKKHGPRPIAHAGELVKTKWGNWKQAHTVRIYEVGLSLVTLKGTIDIGPRCYYFAQRLKKDGTPKDAIGARIVLSNLATSDGKTWSQEDKDFNHCALSWELERL